MFEQLSYNIIILLLIFNGADYTKPSISYLYIDTDINKDDLVFIKNKFIFLLFNVN